MADVNESMSDSAKSTIEVLELVYLSQVAILTLFGNCLVILAYVFGARSIRTYTNYFVVNLSVSDLMVGCISLPFWIVVRSDEHLISEQLYNALISLDVLLGITSILSLAAISIERAIAVKNPATHMNLSERPVMIAIFATWFIGVILSASMYGVTASNDLSISTYTASIFTLGFIIPLAIITASYCMIFHTAVNMMKADNDNVSTMRELRVAKTISLVIGLFLICWSPFFIVNMVFVFCSSCDRPRWLIYVSKMMHYSNSMMNFFIYSVRSPEFRNFFKKILCPREKTRNNQISVILKDIGNGSQSTTERSFSSSNVDSGKALLIKEFPCLQESST